MTKQVFVPLTDEILYEHPELLAGRLVPYVAGRPCYHWLSVELNPDERTPPRQPVRRWNQPARLPIAVKASRGTIHSF